MPGWHWQEIHCPNCKITYWRWGGQSPPFGCRYCGEEEILVRYHPPTVKPPRGLAVDDEREPLEESTT